MKNTDCVERVSERNDAVLKVFGEIELGQRKTNSSVAWMALVGSEAETAVRLEHDVALGTGPGTNVVDGVEVGNAGGLWRCWRRGWTLRFRCRESEGCCGGSL